MCSPNLNFLHNSEYLIPVSLQPNTYFSKWEMVFSHLNFPTTYLYQIFRLFAKIIANFISPLLPQSVFALYYFFNLIYKGMNFYCRHVWKFKVFHLVFHMLYEYSQCKWENSRKETGDNQEAFLLNLLSFSPNLIKYFDLTKINISAARRNATNSEN